MTNCPVTARRPEVVRVSCAAVLRVQLDDEHLILLDTGGAVIGPPGGACAYYPAAAQLLAGLGWQPQRGSDPHGRTDLRGWLPARSLPAFRAWLAAGDSRETWEQCLRREMREEMAEAGLPGLAELAGAANVRHTRTVVENPHPGPGETTRHLEVFVLAPAGGRAGALRAQLLALAENPRARTVIPASLDDIVRRRVGAHAIGSQAAHLLLP